MPDSFVPDSFVPDEARDSFVPDAPVPRQSFLANLINVGVDMAKDIPAQIEDLLNIPAMLLGTPRPPMKSKLATETVPYIMEKATTPIADIPIPTLSYEDIKNIMHGRFTYTETEISPTPLDIGIYSLMGASMARNSLALARWNNQLNRLIKTEEVRGAVMNNMPAFEGLMTQVGVKIEGMDLEAKTDFILYQAKSSPKLGSAIMDLVSGKIAAKPIVAETTAIPKAGISSSQLQPKESIIAQTGLPSVKSMPSEINPIKKIIDAIKKAKDIRGKQETLYTQARAGKLAKMTAVGEEVSGQKGYYARLGALKGELPKVEFESIVKELKQEDIDALFDMIKTSPHLSEWDKLPAFEGLENLLGQTGGRVPTENQIKFLHKVFGKEFTDVLLEKRPLFAKMKEAGLQIANIPRTLMASFFDLSFGFRQGAFFAPRYRKDFFSSFKKQFKWFASEDAFKETMLNVSKNPNYDLAIESGVSFTEMDSLITQREERYASQWAEKIPLIGKGVRMTSRAYTGFANKLRMDVFSRLVQDAESLGFNPREDMDLSKAIAKFVNNGSGRGSIGNFERSATALNAFFFSPRLMASRLSLLNPVYYVNQNPFVRKEALKSLLTFLGAGITILTLSKLMGAEVGTDPRSSDFGKIKIGDTRIDIWGGFQQYIRMAGQLISGKYVSSTTGKVITLGEGYKPLTRLDILMRQIESKEAPVFSFLTDILKGQDWQGKPINIPKEIGLRFVPMVVGDLYDIIKDNPEALPAALLVPFGVGVQTYKQKGRKF